jgi:hypothetical protein
MTELAIYEKKCPSKVRYLAQRRQNIRVFPTDKNQYPRTPDQTPNHPTILNFAELRYELQWTSIFWFSTQHRQNTRVFQTETPIPAATHSDPLIIPSYRDLRNWGLASRRPARIGEKWTKITIYSTILDSKFAKYKVFPIYIFIPNHMGFYGIEVGLNRCQSWFVRYELNWPK